MANAKYQIWDKTSNIYTPVGEELTPEEWISRYGWINARGAVPVVAAGMINGAFSGELSQMREAYVAAGAEFDDGLSDEELLDAIAQYEDEQNAQSDDYVSTEERTAAALEFIAMSSISE